MALGVKIIQNIARGSTESGDLAPLFMRLIYICCVKFLNSSR